jgi:hypothetical protein
VGLGVRVNLEAIQPTEVQHYPFVVHWSPGYIVSAAADRQPQPICAGESNRASHVVDTPAAHDQPWPSAE